jgi:glucosamine--fructose-6-phosphate aminotransferase (isomerizing)
MCGIIGFVGNEPAAPIVLEGLLKLEYRGYDSAGVASIGNGKLHLKKDVGKIGEIDRKHKLAKLPGNIAIAHTRWATHGGVCRENAHPHVDGANQIAVVHNGIVENYRELRRMLEGKGHIFASDTDTEVIPHLIEDCLKAGGTLESAVLSASQKLKGSYAFIVISAKEPDKMIAIRQDNPLVISTGNGGSFATSDILSLPDCDRVVFPEDGELVTLSSRGVAFLNERSKAEKASLGQGQLPILHAQGNNGGASGRQGGDNAGQAIVHPASHGHPESPTGGYYRLRHLEICRSCRQISILRSSQEVL